MPGEEGPGDNLCIIGFERSRLDEITHRIINPNYFQVQGRDQRNTNSGVEANRESECWLA